MGEDGKVGEHFLEMIMNLHLFELNLKKLIIISPDAQAINIILKSSEVSTGVNLAI